MKNTTIVLLLLTNSVIGYSQEWKNNLNAAFKEASVSGKEVLLFFSVAENCESCAKLDHNVLQSDEFRSYAKENFVLVKQDFNSGTADNIEENLLIVEKYNKDGFFPLVVIINKNAKVLGQIGAYNDESPKEYVAKLQSIKRS
ncbi:MAG TPA: thioredoxin family protein [Flavobacterium sp.]|nr:thioredoxin family protein [Flavobacterium sp.]